MSLLFPTVGKSIKRGEVEDGIRVGVLELFLSKIFLCAFNRVRDKNDSRTTQLS